MAFRRTINIPHTVQDRPAELFNRTARVSMFCINVKNAREANHLSLQRMANVMGCCSATITRIEQGSVDPQNYSPLTNTCIKFANLCAVSPERTHTELLSFGEGVSAGERASARASRRPTRRPSTRQQPSA